MSPAIYTNIQVHSDNCFSVTESDQKPRSEGSALETLKKIEQVVKEKLNYRESEENSFSGLSKKSLISLLEARAIEIRDGYRDKVSKLSFVKWLFGFVFLEARAVEAAALRISPPTGFSYLSKDPLSEVFKFLPIEDVKNFSRINKTSKGAADIVELQRAREYGYQGRDLAEAKKFLFGRLKAVDILHLVDYFPRKCLVYKPGIFGRFDCEETLRKLLSLSPSEKEELKDHINYLFLIFVNSNYFCIRDQKDVISLLLDLGASLEVPMRSSRNTALSLAVLNNNKGMVEYLIQKGSRLDVVNSYGVSPLMYNIRNNRKDIFVLLCSTLLERGETEVFNYRDHNGDTALHYALLRGDYQMIGALIRCGSNVNVQNFDGKTPLSMAVSGQRVDIVRLLARNGAII